jgi:hypothetical protein
MLTLREGSHDERSGSEDRVDGYAVDCGYAADFREHWNGIHGGVRSIVLEFNIQLQAFYAEIGIENGRV